MANKLKILGKNSIIYGLSGVFTRMISIFLVPLYTRIFEPSDYGIMNLINSTFTFVGFFTILGLDAAAARWYYEYTEIEERKKTYSSWFWFYLLVCAAFSILLISLTPLAAKYIFTMPVNQSLRIWILPSITLCFSALPAVVWNWLMLQQKAVATVTYTASQSLVTILLTILFTLILKKGIQGVYLALLISGIIYTIIGVFVMKGALNIRFFKMERIRQMLKYSLPLIPASIAYWLLNMSSSYFLLGFKNKAEVGLFSIGTSLASGISLLTMAFQQAWGPFAFSIKDQLDAKETYRNVLNIFAVLSGIVIFGMALFSHDLLVLLTQPAYYGASSVALILSINVILVSLTYIANIGANIAKNNKPYATAVIVSSIFCVVLNFLLVPALGKEGSALATVLAQVIVPVYVFYRAQKMYFIPYQFKRFCIILIASIITSYLVFNAGINHLHYAIALKIILFFAYSAISFFIFARSGSFIKIPMFKSKQ